MRRSHRPLLVEQLNRTLSKYYTRRYLLPNFASVGTSPQITGPHRIYVSGGNIHLGNYVTMQSLPGLPSRIASWAPQASEAEEHDYGHIVIHDHALLMPGLTLIAAKEIIIGKGTMLANSCYISDADWHGLYDRITPPGSAAPIVLGDNVWVGQGVKIGKGVHIGNNTVIGVGSVVIKSLPANVIAAGVPAKPIREIDPTRPMITRAKIYDVENFEAQQAGLLRLAHKNNSWWRWIRTWIAPRKTD